MFLEITSGSTKPPPLYKSTLFVPTATFLKQYKKNARHLKIDFSSFCKYILGKKDMKRIKQIKITLLTIIKAWRIFTESPTRSTFSLNNCACPVLFNNHKQVLFTRFITFLRHASKHIQMKTFLG